MLKIKMKLMKKILVYSLFLIGAMGLLSMSAPLNNLAPVAKKKFTKQIEKNFPISAKGEVVLINKYGNIDVLTWNKNEVQISIEIVVNATNQSVADDVFETISVNFEDSRDRVFAETLIESKESYWWNWGNSLKSDFQINYKVHMPISCSADFSNKYGDLDIMDLENDAKINVKYGNLTMGDLAGTLDLYLGYGKAYSGILENVRAEIKYSKYRCESLRDFTADTKYSGIVINNGQKIITNSKYDNYNLGTIQEFINEGKYDNLIIESCEDVTIETKYSDLKIEKLIRSLSAEINYGGIKVKELKQNFDNIYIESNYAGVDIYTEEGTGFQLNLNSKYVEVKIPDTKGMDEDVDGSTKNIEASYKGKGKGKMVLDMNYGQLKIK
jgi:hypothetical protein